MIVGVVRATQFAFQNSLRNLWLSVVTIFLLVLTTLSITVVVSLNVVGQKVIEAVEQKVDVDLYFYDSAQEKEIIAARDFLVGMEEVSDVIYLSKEDALEDFVKAHANDQQILSTLAELEENVLPASLTIRAVEIENYPKIISRFERSEYNTFVDHADYSDNKDLIIKISHVTGRAYQLGLGVSVIFIIISVIVIFNTIRITIYSHREEVGIMKLVGATNWFIRAPFILESVLLGCVAAVITIGLFYGLLYVSDPSIRTFFEGYDFSALDFFQVNILIVLFVEVVGAVLLSAVSSMIAITRYLKV